MAYYIPTLSKIQAISGLTFGSFLGLHLGTHILAHFGIEKANQGMFLFRRYYQNPLVEPIVILASGIIHIGTGIAKYYLRSRRKTIYASTDSSAKKPRTSSIRRNWHQFTGWYVLVFLPGHYLATRIVPNWFYVSPSSSMNPTGGIDETFPAYTLINLPYIFFPYYITFSAAGMYHLLVGVRKAWNILGGKFKINREAYNLVASIAVLAASSSILALGGVYFHFNISRSGEYLEMANSVISELRYKLSNTIRI
ncbi:uncharacterized protein VTP21DRAFT_9099 [Calcarisporiella thermophila]|uniref:uncharacterized protein n=1 Tax=Calcarisporiella thermophila TaxID=911321 RepID=UPI0037447347